MAKSWDKGIKWSDVFSTFQAESDSLPFEFDAELSTSLEANECTSFSMGVWGSFHAKFQIFTFWKVPGMIMVNDSQG